MSVQAYCLHSPASHVVCGVAQGPKSDDVLVTVQNDGVVCCSSSRQEQTKSWALASQNLAFVVPAVYSQADEHYHAVVTDRQATSGNLQTLLSWPATVTHGSLEQAAQRTVLSGAVHSIHAMSISAHTTAPNASRSQPQGVAIVFTDGRVLMPTNTAGTVSAGGSAARVINAGIDGTNLAVVCSSNGGAEYTLELHALQGIVPAAVYSIPTPQDAAKLVAASYSSHQLLTLWSSGSMDCFDINASGNSLKLRTSRKLPAFASSSKAVIPEAQAKPSRARKRRQPEEDTANVPATAQTSSPAIFPLGNHTVAAVRQLTDLPTNGHTASAVEVIVTDSSYGCIQSVTSVKLPKAKADAKLQLQPGSIFQQRTGAGDMVLLFGGAVWLFSIPVKEASLAAAIGALNFRAPANPAALAAAAAVGEEQCESSCRPPQIEHARPAWSQSLAESGEASTSGQPAQFSIALPALFTWRMDASSQQAQLLEQQLTQQLQAGWSDKEDCRAFLVDLLRRCRESKLHLSSSLLLRLVAHLTQQQWWSALDTVLRQQPLMSLAMCPGLLLTLCQEGQFFVLPALFTKAKEVPVEELIAVLRLFLSPATAASQNAYQQYSQKLGKLASAAVEAAEKACISHASSSGQLAVLDPVRQDKVVRAAYAAAAVDGLTAQEMCFHPIVALAHDSTLLLSALRQLSGAQALSLAHYLLKLLAKYTDSLSDVMPAGLEESKSPLRIPKLQQVLDWMALLLDAHLHSLHRQPGALQALEKLQKLVQQQVGLTKQMALMRGISEQLASQAVLPYSNRQADALYSVELLDFRIH